MNHQFTPIDVTTWPRGEEFYYFSKLAPTGYSICVNMNVSRLRADLKARGKKFYPAYLYLVTRVINLLPEFRTAIKDEMVGFYQMLTPLYACFHEENKTISLMWTEYNESFSAFHQAYLEDAAAYGGRLGLLSKPGLPPENSYIVSCIPWIHFNSFSLHSYEKKDYFLPSIEAGKFEEKDGTTLMPLSITAHHAATDGYHLTIFIQELQRLMDQTDIWIDK